MSKTKQQIQLPHDELFSDNTQDHIGWHHYLQGRICIQMSETWITNTIIFNTKQLHAAWLLRNTYIFNRPESATETRIPHLQWITDNIYNKIPPNLQHNSIFTTAQQTKTKSEKNLKGWIHAIQTLYSKNKITTQHIMEVFHPS